MEAFSLLKYWRGAPGVPLLSSSNTTTLLTSVPLLEENSSYSVADQHIDGDDDGPFFDFEFTLPDDAEDDNHHNPKHNHNEEEDEDDDNIEESEGEREFKLVHVEEEEEEEEDPSSLEPHHPKPHHFNSSFFKSAAKFRVFMSALKKSKSASSNAASDSVPPNPTPQINPESSHKKQQQQGEKDRKFFTVKFKVNEEISIKSLFTRDNSSKGNNNNNKDSSPEEKQRFSKEAIQKYLKIVKPLYVKVSRRYGDKLSFSGNLNDKAEPAPETEQKKHGAVKVDSGGEGVGTSTNRKSQKVPAGLKVVCKHLGKSRSASSAVAAAPPSVSSKRRDDSLLQQEDGIQGAILHCKRSFNTSTECQIPQLPRCVSEP